MNDDDFLTPPETPSSKARQIASTAVPRLVTYRKPEIEKSEAWASIVAVLGIIGAALPMTSVPGRFFALGSLIITVAVYAYFHTSLPSMRSGWKTQAFIGAAINIVGSVALAVSQADFPFLPAGVTKYAALVSASITAAGYTVYRYQIKKVEAEN